MGAFCVCEYIEFHLGWVPKGPSTEFEYETFQFPEYNYGLGHVTWPDFQAHQDEDLSREH